MKRTDLLLAALTLGLAVAARAQEHTEDGSEASGAVIAPELAVPAEAPRPEPAPAKAEPKAAPRPKRLGSEERLVAEWKYLKEAAQDTTAGVPAASAEDLEVFIQQHPDAPTMDDAQGVLASLYQKQGDYKAAMVALLRLLYEHPSSNTALRAKSDLFDMGDKNLSRKQRAALGELVKVPDSPDTSERLAVMLQRTVDALGDALYDAAVPEIRRFQVRYPDYAKADMVQMSLAQLHEKNLRYPVALMAYRKLIAVFPESAYRAKAQLAVAGVYADSIKDTKKAIEAYQELVDKYPDSPEVLPALARSAQLFSERLKQYELAVEMDEKIIKLFPKTEGALKAFKDQALLLHGRLLKPEDALKTYQRLAAAQFPEADSVEALQSAAVIARKDLKDFRQEAELRARIAADFSGSKEAPAELYNAAYIYESDLVDLDKAVSTYKQVTEKFPHAKPSRWATDRIVKIEKKKAQEQ